MIRSIVRFISVCLLLVSTISCSKQEEVIKSSKLPQYDIDLNQEQVSLIDFVDDVHFTFLEETEGSLFSGIRELIITEEVMYLVNMKARKLMKFKPDGTFINGIEDRGNGPAEYNQIGNLVLRQDTLIGIDFIRQRALKWDSELHFIDAKSLGFRLNDFVSRGNGFLVDVNYGFLDNSEFNMNNMLFMNNEFEIEKAAVPFKYVQSLAPGGHALFNKVGSDIFYRSSLNDTIFKIDGITNEVAPAYRFNLGELWLYGTEIQTNEEYLEHYESGYQNIEMLKYLGWLEDETLIVGKSYMVPSYESYGFFIDKEANQTYYVDWELGTEGFRNAFNPILLQNGRVYGSLHRDEFEYLMDQIPADDRSMLRDPNFKVVEGENPILVSFKVKFPEK